MKRERIHIGDKLNMTKEEYFKWKAEYPNEWHEVFQETMRSFIKETYMAGKHSDDIMFECPSANKDNRVYTVGRVANALINENDCCDDMVRMKKQSLNYKKSL